MLRPRPLNTGPNYGAPSHSSLLFLGESFRSPRCVLPDRPRYPVLPGSLFRWSTDPNPPGASIRQPRRHLRPDECGPAESFILFREDLDALWNIPPEYVFALKVSYWWGR